MINQLQWTKRAAQVMAQATNAAVERNSSSIQNEHLLIALIREPGGAAADVMRQVLALDEASAIAAIDRVCAPFAQKDKVKEVSELAPSVQATLTRAHNEAQKAQHPYIGTEHLLLALVSSNDRVIRKVLAELNVTPEAIRLKLHEQIPEIAAKGSELERLTERFKTEFTHNLAYYLPQPIRKLFGRWIDPSQPPPLG